MGNSAKRAVPPELERLIPSEIEKGIYYRLYPRKDGVTRLVWWVKLYDREGRPLYESTDSSRYSDAVALHRKISAQIQNQHRSGGDADSVRLGQLLDEFLTDGTKATNRTKYIYRLVIENKLKPFFGKIRASKLTTQHTKKYREERKSGLLARRLKVCSDPTPEQREQWVNSAGATVNRELARLRTALEYGRRQTPPKVISIPHFHMESERDNVRKVVLNDSDYPALRDAFKDPGVRLLFIISSHVGIRASELKRICWEQVDFDRRVIRLERGKTKNKDPRSAPIFGDMVEALVEAKRERDDFYADSPWVFSRGGEQIKDFRQDWSQAVLASGIPHLHFHDLRRTAQRLMRRAGIDKITRMRIMGHKTDAMDIRYGVVEDDDVVEAGVKLERTFQTFLGHSDGDSNGSDVGVPPPSGASVELLARLANVPEDKLKAMVALLGV